MSTDSMHPPTLPHPVTPLAARTGVAGPVAPTPALAAPPDTDRGRRADSTADALLPRRLPNQSAGGTRFGEFLLLEEIGRGAFSRVFLARQPALADRTVVVKVTTTSARESNALGRLRHPNIMPIHSVHKAADRHLVCMPYLGTVTLADVYRALESMPSLPDSGRDLFCTLTTRRAAGSPTDRPGDAPPPAPRPAEAAPALTSLAGRSYVEAVLWLAARLADALAHAHDAGVVHRDLKPANVLLADDGQPVLLDFNLASPEATAADETRGGTPQYMSPEQLEAFAGHPRPVDRRADLYSLGVMLFELLTRRSPFPRHRPIGEALQTMIGERAASPPRLRPWNRAVSPAVEAIVRRCLEPDPAARYRSAHELKADLERHLADRPLWHTAEPSARERAGKCWRRNRGYVLAAGLTAVVLAAATAVESGFSRRDDRLARFEAATTAGAFAADAQMAAVTLLEAGDRAKLDDGIRAAEAALDRYGAAGRPNWWATPVVRALPPADQERLRNRAGELLVLLGRATAQRAVRDAGQADPTPGLRRAFELNTAALDCYPDRQGPRGLWEHRAELARLLGRSDEARDLAKTAADQPADTASGRRLQAHRHLSQRQHASALPLLADLSRDEPQDFAVWYMLGLCHLELGRPVEAGACFSTCVALQPECHWGWYQRGRALSRQREHDQARVAYARASALQPGLTVDDPAREAPPTSTP